MGATQVYLGIGVVLFAIVMGWIGYLSYKKTNNISDFAIAGSKLGPTTLGLSFAATYFSAATFVGYVGWTYDWGLSSLWIFLSLIGTGPIGLLLIAKRAREINVSQNSLSLPDWLGDYYNSDFVRVGVALLVFFNVFYIATQLIAGAIMFNLLLGIPYALGLVFILVVVVAYVIAGGTYADVYTDAVQAVLMAVAALVVFASGFWVIGGGGFTGVMERVSTGLAEQGTNMISPINPESAVFYSIPAIVGAFIIQFSFPAQPQLFNKVLALEDPRAIRKMILVYVVTVFCFLLVMFGGLYAAVTLPEAVGGDQAVFAYVESAFPAIAVALFGVVVLAAALSTTDGIFIVLSTAIANDIYRKFLVRRGYVNTPEDQVDRIALTLSRLTILLVAVIAGLLALNPPASIGVFFWIGISGIASGVLGPIIVGLFFPRRASATAAKISMVSGVGSYLVIVYANFEQSPLAAGAWAVLIGIATMFVASFGLRNRASQGSETVR